MARRRNSTALFEVIHAGKMDRKPAGEALRTPRWWFKAREKGDPGTAPAPADPSDPTANVTAATLFRFLQRPAAAQQPAPAGAMAVQPAREVESASAVELASPPPSSPLAAVPAEIVEPAPAPAASVALPSPIAAPPVAPPVAASVALPVASPVATPVAPDEPSPAPVLARIDDSDVPAAQALAFPASPRGARTFGGRSGMLVAFDGDRQEMTLRVRYTAALVSAFALLVVVGLAYVLGRHMAEGPSQAAGGLEAAPSSAQLKKGPAQPAALDIIPRVARTATPRAADGPPGGGRPAGQGPASSFAGAPANGAFLDAPMAPDGSARRTANMNYLLIQSYRPDQRSVASEVRDYLTIGGIPCTVEKDWSKLHIPQGWCAVVGTRGFPRSFGQAAEYEAYVKAIQGATGKYPNKTKLDRVQPVPFKWAE